MALALTVNHRWSDGKRTHLICTVTASGNYVGGGDALNLAEGLSQNPPISVDINGESTYLYQFNPGTLSTNGLMLVRDLAAAAAEIAAAGYPGGVTADVIKIHAIFDNLQ